ncbi:uncharacterized protein LOC106674352 [Cimex lectularius]|uniref:CPR type cuticle protein n=1 Tax=Cimex lectularius TaxID=79782 RepID=A0A8I6SDL8_CIMLE|nr:uncharacterized protein LOC106674352 [Cimex lectularius]
MKLRFIIIAAIFGVCFAREKRSIGWFSLKKPSPVTKYPVWKVHKYSGIALKPVDAHLESSPVEYVVPVEHLSAQPKAVQVSDYTADHYHDEPEHLNIENLSEFLPRANDDSGNILSYFGLGSTHPEAEEKVSKVPGVGLKKKWKKKDLLSLLALSKLVDSKKLAFKKGGVSALLKGLVGVEEVEDVDDGVGLQETVYPVETTVLKSVPAKHSFFSKIPFLGGFGKGAVVHIPEPSLPSLPALKFVPAIPKLPKISLSGHYKLPYSTGTYVSIRAPKPAFPVEHVTTHYATPVATYSAPHQQNYSPVYTPAEKEPVLEYSLPHPAPEQKFTPSAPYPPASYPAPPSNEPAPYPAAASGPYPPAAYAPSQGVSDQYQPQYKYTGPSSYQTTYDASVSASELEPSVLPLPTNERKEDSSETKEETTNEDTEKN